jgi:hypothetical protein
MSRDTLAAAEKPVEEAVTSHLGAMRLLWIDVDDEADPRSLRGSIERNAIALLSNFELTHLPLIGWAFRVIDRSFLDLGSGISAM